jgi:hypothetical protein
MDSGKESHKNTALEGTQLVFGEDIIHAKELLF